MTIIESTMLIFHFEFYKKIKEASEDVLLEGISWVVRIRI